MEGAPLLERTRRARVRRETRLQRAPRPVKAAASAASAGLGASPPTKPPPRDATSASVSASASANDETERDEPSAAPFPSSRRRRVSFWTTSSDARPSSLATAANAALRVLARATISSAPASHRPSSSPPGDPNAAGVEVPLGNHAGGSDASTRCVSNGTPASAKRSATR